MVKRGQSWMGVLVFFILLIAAVGSYVFYKIDVKKVDASKNSTILNELNYDTNSSDPSVPKSKGIGCFLSSAKWEKNNAEIANARQGDTILLSTYAENCAGKKINLKIYSENIRSDISIKSFSSTIAGSSSHLSFVIDSSMINDSTYYFTASLEDNVSNSIDSGRLLISSGPLALNNLRDPLLCNGYGDDRDYLYNVNVSVFNKGNGKQSFTVALADKILRTNNTAEDRFFADNSNGALQISYNITSFCGGVDITYSITNPTSQSQVLPDFLFGGLQQSRTNPRSLDLFRGGMVVSAQGSTNLYGSYYPSSFVYSPITIAISDDLSQGTSIQYPFMDYNVETIPQLVWALDGSISYRYVLVHPSSSGPVTASILPGDHQEYTISLRFAPSHNWILTLYPYKKYFLSKYNSVQKKSPKNLKPVEAVSEAYEEYVNSTNPRGYVYWYTGKLLNDVGWADEVTRLIGLLSSNGYTRVMLWHTAGTYDPKICVGCNFPSQAMNWLPKLVETEGELMRLKQAGISLGFWWGRSGQVTIPDVWPPTSISSIINANYSDTAHHNYLMNQFTLARQRGVDAIGLDSFTFMEPYGRYKWLEEMQGISSSTEYIQEHGGADIFHARSGNFYTDSYDGSSGKWTESLGPSLLSWYINPNSEVWMYAPISNKEYLSLGQSFMTAHAQQLIKWGYTYVDNGYVNASTLDLTVSQCLDGKDNNGDGLVDWPKDPSCSSEFDETEG